MESKVGARAGKDWVGKERNGMGRIGLEWNGKVFFDKYNEHLKNGEAVKITQRSK